jgi:CheY-like chemotaxis protein
MNQKLKIFVVDNDKIYLTVTQKLLSKISASFSVSVFYDGIEAFEAIETLITSKPSELPDLILLDLDMPIMDGWDFLESYNKIGVNNYKSIPIYIVTSSIALEDINKSNNYQDVLGYLVKPLNLETLEGIVLKN